MSKLTGRSLKSPSSNDSSGRKRPAPDDLTLSVSASPQQRTRVIQIVKTPHTTVNHSYVDYSLVPPARPGGDNGLPKHIKDMDFHQKLHHMLNRDDLKELIHWLPHGRAFRVQVPSKFEKTICMEYFGHKRYSSFLYQLGVHGYKQITVGKDRGAYYSPLLLRGLTHLTNYMPNPKEFRHLTRDPDNEPDFYLIQFIAPLPDDEHFGRNLTMDDVLQYCRDAGRSEDHVTWQLQQLTMKQG